jgi:thiol-disulfide isomerase/thioredoxin
MTPGNRLRTFAVALASAILLLLVGNVAFSQPASAADADVAWKQVQQAAALRSPPQSAGTNQQDEVRRYKRNADFAIATAVKAKAFYTQFPDSPNAATAKLLESKMLRRADILYRAYRRLHALNNSIDIKFTALDGRDVDISQMKGKVVLIDFWATWCEPCVAEIPHIQEAYKKFHARGFEVVGISFDTDGKALNHFIQQHKIPWPQYFDGRESQNKFDIQFGIEAIPTLWLVDKKGVMCDASAADNLPDKIQKLLAE